MPSALSIACGVETDVQLDRWDFLFPFRSFYAGFCRGILSPASAARPAHNCNHTLCHCNINSELHSLLESIRKNRRDLEDLEKEWSYPRCAPRNPLSLPTPLPSSTPLPQAPSPTSPPQQEQSQQKRPRPVVQTRDIGTQTQKDAGFLVYQALLEDKIEQFKEQELMISRLQEHLAIVKEQLADALEAEAAAAAAAAAATTAAADNDGS
ncbi:hypothetical protein BX666DRAFT_2024522 [Dichotomocladium elegans]|nr:hypothetical protein BX666DRAFT_2024522 [Dichotomocladium elegans]